MKNIILAIAFLAITASVSASHCELKCTNETETWKGDTSLEIDVGKSIKILINIEFKLFVVINFEKDIVYATNGKFSLILNIKTGDYILIDNKTNYAVCGKITIDFLDSNGSINITKLCITINVLMTKYTSITSSTSSSFNFYLLVVSYYSLEFDIEIIYKGQAKVIEDLKVWKTWLYMVQVQIEKNVIRSGNCSWGFFVVILEIEVEVAIAIFNCIKITVEYFGTLEIRIMVEIIKIMTYRFTELIVFSQKLVAIISTGLNLSVDYIIKWCIDVANNPNSVEFSVGGSVYIFSVIRIDKHYVLHFTMKSSTGRIMDIIILYMDGVLVIINNLTNICVALHGREFLIINSSSEYALVGSWRLVGGARGKIVIAVGVSEAIRNQNYTKLIVLIKALIKKHSSGQFSLAVLYKACISGSLTEIAAVVGKKYARIVLIYYRAFFMECVNGGSAGGIISGVFGYKGSIIVTIFFVPSMDAVIAIGGSWEIIIKAILSGAPPKIKTHTSTSTSKYTYTYTMKGK